MYHPPRASLLLGLLALLLGLGRNGIAAVPDDLYQAAVPVQERGEEGRNAAVRQALHKVLVKITGSRTLAGREAARALVQEATGLVQQYRYEHLPAGPEGTSGGRLLVVRFDPDALMQALRQRGLPAWGAGRPSVLLWLGLEDDGQRRFFQPERDAEVAEILEGVAEERGIGFVFPLLDLEDLGRIQARDLWGGFESPVREASARYGADLVLIGRARRSAGGWRVEWRLLHAHQGEQWMSRGSRDQALGGGLQEAVDRIAARYAPLAGGGAEAVLVRVRGVTELAAFLRVDRFLRGMDGMEQVSAVQVEPEQVLFRVRIRGGSDALRRAASLGGVLQAERPETPPLAPGAAAAAPLLPDLSFRLVD